MKSDETEHHHRSEEFKSLEMRDVNSMISHMPKLLEELKSKIDILPNVDKEGRSECPFAEDLYFEKEEVVEKVAAELRKLRKCIPVVDEEISTRRKSLATIRADARSLRLVKAREEYIHAEEGQVFQIKEKTKLRERLIDLISQTEDMLKLAQTKKWPLGEPQEKLRPPALSGGPVGLGSIGSLSPPPSTAVPPGPSLKSELDSLISLGPIGKSKQSKRRSF